MSDYSNNLCSATPSLGSAIGNTPLIKLRRLSKECAVSIYAKMECQNPGGSIKDRTSFAIVQDAVQSGRLQPGSTVIESSSGNMALGLAQACIHFGLRFIAVTDPHVNDSTLRLLELYGTRIERVTTADPDTGFLGSRLKRVKAILDAHPDYFWTDQYHNPLNPRTQRNVMAEICRDLPSAPDYMFAATSTCGSLVGSSSYIQDEGLPTQVVAVDAVGSLIFSDQKSERLIPGFGAGIRSDFLRDGHVDRVVHRSGEQSIRGCWNLLRSEALLLGGSCGASISAIQELSAEMDEGSVCVFIAFDRGERYLNTMYNEGWIAEHFPTLPIDDLQAARP